ncbi:nitrate- and nitrite sensing domain-containing protein [Streptomyces sp. DSM 110735]|uniref:sensor histidine kinase n=1 Tax=Streptomyces sp. DSM 110735 TaxID=2775031 RepID=UPI0018F4D87E|nr:ATP-binding protein [Streptomyces sp. DSM 110735]MBJ7907548.1 nitrate- and nitrite sensing domain-containing protein [Streptomyces sp. DSM 110735]
MRRLRRPTTVRARIVALALAPAVALMALWGFAMVSVTGELRALIRLQGVYVDYGSPVDTAIGQIQIERRVSAAYLGTPRERADPGDLLAQQRRTDRAVAHMRHALASGDLDRLTARQRRTLDTMTAATGELDGLRRQVLQRRLTWDRAVTAYSALVEPGFAVESALTALQAGQLARESQTVIELVRVREFVSREDALVAGARAEGGLTERQYDTLTATIEDRRVFERTYVPDLPAPARDRFRRFQQGDLHRSLVSGEDALLRAGAAGSGAAVAADTWRSVTDRAVIRYRELCVAAAKDSAARGRTFAYAELTKASVVGVAGLAAVALSLWLAVRGARRVSRRLERLRDAADLLSTRQLPDVMRRLSAGEQVDAAAEAPPLAADDIRDDEIGQVGRSFNAARLAAVEAAVTQATLRRGLFAVLLNIARRNQALVHRQLKLVDTLERSTEDPELLRRLFLIDHLTTRMRRHAESLIILSGATPGRRWRGPVPLADVVASAVSEIEAYERVVVPPLPDLGIAADSVADVVHLVAELLENATAFSPPHTEVTLRTARVGDGFALEIDDRGLGLDAVHREEAHRTLTAPDAFDPTRHDRLGLYVVGRLAARHGIEVSLRDSPYGGTTASVRLPPAVLAEGELVGKAGVAGTRGTRDDGGGGGDGGGSRGSAGSGGSGGRGSGGGWAGADSGRVGAGWANVGAGDGGAGSGDVGRAGSGDMDTVADGDLSGTGAAGGAPPRPTGPRDSPPRTCAAPRTPPAVPGRPGAPALPTRVRQASLARELREEPPPETPDTAADPEEMRAIFGAFQRGRDLGRQDSETPTEPGAPAPAPRPAPRDHPSTHVDEGMDTDDVR